MTHRVVFEIEIDANSELDAAKDVQEMIQNPDNYWQFYVQDTNTDKVYSVDLQEEDEDAVLELVTKYDPLIK